MTRSRTAERKKVREQHQRRRRRITIVVAVVAVVAIVALMVIVSTQPVEAPLPERSMARYADIQQSRTEQGYPRLGDPRAAVQVALYCAFDSIPCQIFHDEAIEPILERVSAGDVALAYVPLYGQVGNAQGAARAAVCAADQGLFWQFGDALYLWLINYGPVQAFTGNRINSGASNVGLNRGQFDACMTSSAAAAVTDAAVREANALTNFAGVPAVAINGIVPVDDANRPITDVQGILAAIDEAVARVRASRAPASTAEATSAATAEATASATAEVSATSEATAAATASAASEATAAATPG